MFDFSSQNESFGRFEFSLGQLDNLEETIRRSLAKAGIHGHGTDDPGRMRDASTRTIDRAYSVGSEPRLTVENFAGETHIEGGDEGVIRVRASGLVVDDTGMPRNIRQDGDHLLIEQVNFPGPKPVEYHISVPRGCRVTVTGVEAEVNVVDVGGATEVETVSGDVSLAGIEDGCRINAVNGDITLDRIAGTCILSSMSSDITGTRLNGAIEAHAVDGDISIDRSNVSRCTISAISGDLHLETGIDPDGDYTMQSTNGDVRLTVPAGAAVTATLVTQQGDIAAGNLDINRRDHHRREGTLNGGGAAVKLESLHGDVALYVVDDLRFESEPAPVTEPIPPVEPMPAVEPIRTVDPVAEIHPLRNAEDWSDADQAGTVHGGQAHEPEREHTVDVLTRLERGELSVEEAMAHLNDL